MAIQWIWIVSDNADMKRKHENVCLNCVNKKEGERDRMRNISQFPFWNSNMKLMVCVRYFLNYVILNTKHHTIYWKHKISNHFKVIQNNKRLQINLNIKLSTELSREGCLGYLWIFFYSCCRGKLVQQMEDILYCF